MTGNNNVSEAQIEVVEHNISEKQKNLQKSKKKNVQKENKVKNCCSNCDLIECLKSFYNNPCFQCCSPVILRFNTIVSILIVTAFSSYMLATSIIITMNLNNIRRYLKPPENIIIILLKLPPLLKIMNL